MRKPLPVLLLSAALASSVANSRQASSPPGQNDLVTSPGNVQPSPSAATTLRVGGTIDKYDASIRVLTLITTAGTVQFALAATARIRRHGRQIDAADLENLSGCRA